MIIVLFLGWGILYADRTTLYPLLPVVAQSLGITSAQAGTLSSMYFLFYVLLQIPSGVAADRWGAKRVLMVMYALLGIGVLGTGLFGGAFSLLLLFSALHGFGAGAYYPCCYGTLLATVPHEKRGVSSGFIGMGMALGILGGMAASGPLYTLFDSYRTPFVILAVPTFLMIPLFQRAIPETRTANAPSWNTYLSLFRDWDLWKINGAMFCSLYGFWVATTWGPTFLQAERGFSLTQSGLYTGLVALAALPAGVLWGKLSDRFGRKKLALFILSASAVALFLLTKAESASEVIAAFLFFGAFSNSAVSPVAVAWMGDIVTRKYPGSMNAAVGFFNGTIMSSAIVAPLLSGILRDMTGSLIPSILAACALLAGGTVLFLLTPERS